MITELEPLDHADIARAAGLTLDDFTDEDFRKGQFAPECQTGHENYMVEEALLKFESLDMIFRNHDTCHPECTCLAVGKPKYVCNGAITICNFLKRQFDKPSNAPDMVRKRVEKHRNLKSNTDVTPKCNAIVTSSNAIEEEVEVEEDIKPLCKDKAFALFWELYPRKTNRKKTELKFKSLPLDEALLNSIMQGLERQKKSPQWLKDGGQFIPHPTTWLNGERWNDEVSTISKVKTAEEKEMEATWGR